MRGIIADNESVVEHCCWLCSGIAVDTFRAGGGYAVCEYSQGKDVLEVMYVHCCDSFRLKKEFDI